LPKKFVAIIAYLCLITLPIISHAADGILPQQIVIRNGYLDFLATDSEGLIGCVQVGQGLNICRVDVSASSITVLGTINMSDTLCLGFDWSSYRYYILTYSRLSAKYEVWILGENFVIIDKKPVNIAIPSTIRLFSLAVNGSDIWMGYYSLVSLRAGIIKLDSELSNVILNITLDAPPNFQGNTYMLIDLAVYSDAVLAYDTAFDIYSVSVDGTRKHIINVYDNSSDLREEYNVTACFPMGITTYGGEMYVGMRIYWVEDSQPYEGVVFLSYPIPTETSGGAGPPQFSGLDIIAICSVVIFLLAIVISKTAIVVVPTKAELFATKEYAKEGVVLEKAGVGVEGTGEEETQPPGSVGVGGLVISEDLMRDFEEYEGTLNRIRKLLGIRKIWGIAKRYKDKKPRPNFDRALGILAIIGLAIGVAIYFIGQIDIFVALGMNIGMLISVGGLIASTAMILLWWRGLVEFTRKLFIFITAIYIPLSIYGIIINLITMISYTAILPGIEAIIATILTLRELIQFLIARSLIILSTRKTGLI